MSMKQPRGAALSTNVFKVVIIGNSSVGKTALIQRFTNDIFSQTIKPTISAELEQIEVNVDGKQVKLQIWDTVGQERFQSLGQAFYREAHCCVLVFDLNNPESFEAIEEWKDIFLQKSNPTDSVTFPFILIGTKTDQSDANRKQVTEKATEWCTKTAQSARKENLDESSSSDLSPNNRLNVAEQKYLKEYKIPYFEVSSKTGDKVNDCFLECAKQCLKHKLYLSKRSTARRTTMAVKKNSRTADLTINTAQIEHEAATKNPQSESRATEYGTTDKGPVIVLNQRKAKGKEEMGGCTCCAS